MNALGDYIKREVQRAEWEDAMSKLRGMSVEQLRVLWDGMDDGCYCDGHDAVHVQAALNEKGDGAYCAW